MSCGLLPDIPYEACRHPVDQVREVRLKFGPDIHLKLWDSLISHGFTEEPAQGHLEWIVEPKEDNGRVSFHYQIDHVQKFFDDENFEHGIERRSVLLQGETLEFGVEYHTGSGYHVGRINQITTISNIRLDRTLEYLKECIDENGLL